jgi:hypothetical protein
MEMHAIQSQQASLKSGCTVGQSYGTPIEARRGPWRPINRIVSGLAVRTKPQAPRSLQWWLSRRFGVRDRV